MKRPWQIWTIFVLCAGMVIGSMGWFTYTVLDLRNQNREALEQAAVEEVIRRALWRMEATISPILVEESSRPYFDYNTFSPQNGVLPIAGTQQQSPPNTVPSPLLTSEPDMVNVYFQYAPDGRITSPQVPEKALLSAARDNDQLNQILDMNCTTFNQFKENVGTEDLPQTFALNWGTSIVHAAASTPEMASVSSEEKDQDPTRLQADIAQVEITQQAASSLQPPWQTKISSPTSGKKGAPVTTDDPQVGKLLNPDTQNDYITGQIAVNQSDGYARGNTLTKAQNRANKSKTANYRNLEILNAEAAAQEKQQTQANTTRSLPKIFGSLSWSRPANARQRDTVQTVENADESYAVDNNVPLFPEQQELTQQIRVAEPAQARIAVADKQLAYKYTPEVPVRFDGSVSEDIMRPFWLNDMLIVARRVVVDNKPYIQGAWLNWASLEQELLAEISDLLPEARLVKIDSGQAIDQSRALAALPVGLLPGALAALPVISEAPITIPLSLAWGSVLLASIAVGGLLAGVLVLSERRATFVSAVTHELRTPLTTFRLYTEMLAEGIIRDEKKRDEYVNTLYRESNRLGHLVENVLAYARLERGTGARTLETLRISELLDRVRNPLTGRATQAGMELVIEHNSPDGDTFLHTDQPAVEQILYNLVDNACKYAADVDDKRIHLTAIRQGASVVLRVCDHGLGLDKREARRLFRPFRKSARAAAQSAPGVGLGLALCSRLARQLGGRLRYEDRPEAGACFVLKLPVGTGT